MAADENPRVEPGESHRVRKAVLFYRNLVSHVIELGQIARIEIEIQHRFPHAASPPRCPRWHDHSSPHGPEAPR
jgi:hypothetical protein